MDKKETLDRIAFERQNPDLKGTSIRHIDRNKDIERNLELLTEILDNHMKKGKDIITYMESRYLKGTYLLWIYEKKK